MTIDKQALREAAEKADSGEWSYEEFNRPDLPGGSFVKIDGRDAVYCLNKPVGGIKQSRAVIAFIAAFNPKVALALLDDLEKEKGYASAYEGEKWHYHQLAESEGERANRAEAKLEAAEKRIAELERSETQLIDERDNAESALNDAYKAVMGQAPEWSNWFSFANAIDEIELACELWRNQTDDVIQFRQRIAELEAKLETADRLQDGAFRDGLKAGFSYGQTDDQSGFAQCMSAYSTCTGIGVKQQEDSVDSDVGRNQPGIVVAVHIGAGDFVKVKGQVFEVEETDFDDHDVTLWFVGGNALKCAAGCPVEVVSAPVAAGIKVKGE
ncbi:ead/Ea22-like family protein [Salmonella enterica]|nr:ead/Ea22-like family protein [Salmonella enterica]